MQTPTGVEVSPWPMGRPFCHQLREGNTTQQQAGNAGDEQVQPRLTPLHPVQQG